MNLGMIMGHIFLVIYIYIYSRFISEYTVTDILGEGGFGCVFEAENRYDETKYAVKRIPVQPGG